MTSNVELQASEGQGDEHASHDGEGREPAADTAAAVGNVTGKTKTSLAATTGKHRSGRYAELTDEQPKIVEKAAAFCVRHFPTLWTAGWPIIESGSSSGPDKSSGCRWIVPVLLRYDAGVEGGVGSLAYDPETDTFTLLTDRATMSQRAREVAASVGRSCTASPRHA